MLTIILCSILLILIVILWTIRAAPSQQIFGEPLDENLKLSAQKPTVLFLGDGNVKGEFATSFIERLLENSSIQNYQVINGGNNFETISSLFQRLKQFKDFKFDYVFVLVGTMDVAVGQGGPLQVYQSVFRGQRTYFDRDQFEKEYRLVVKQLKQMTTKQVSLITLPLLGESIEGWGQEKAIYFSNIIREISVSEKCGLIDFNKSLQKKMFGEGDVARISRDFDGGWLLMETFLRHFFLWEKVSVTRRRSGMRWTTDLIHINKKSADLLSMLIAQYIVTRTKPNLK